MAKSDNKPNRPNRTLLEYKCEQCDNSFYRRRLKAGLGRYCGLRCKSDAQQIPLADRFWAKVNKDGPIVRAELGPCWVWTAGCDEYGYGILNVDGQTTVAHRVSWEMGNGPIPDGLCSLHKCDNPPCVRPHHLFLGTRGDNVHDCISKGRFHNQINP